MKDASKQKIEVKKWQTGVLKSSDEKGKNESVSVSESNYRKRRRGKTDRVHREPKASFVNKSAGRPNCLDREKHTKLLEAYYSHPYSLRELADMFGVSRMTVWRAVQEPYPSDARMVTG